MTDFMWVLLWKSIVMDPPVSVNHTYAYTQTYARASNVNGMSLFDVYFSNKFELPGFDSSALGKYGTPHEREREREKQAQIKLKQRERKKS